MFDRAESARHLPYFAELAALDDGDAAWRSVSAGLVVLRLVDAWIEEGAAAVSADGWGVRSVEAAIEEMPLGDVVRTVLTGVIEAIKSASAGDMHAIAPRLMAYGRALDLDAKWALAADVYETIIAHVHPVEESDVAIAAHLRLGTCLLKVGALADASVSFDAASAIANDIDDMFGILRAQIGHAKVALARGNTPNAERLLDETIAAAALSPELMEVHAVALQDRADVAFHRARYDLAVELAYRSLELTHDPMNRDRLLFDIATAFYKLGVHSAARDAWLILEATAQEQFIRWRSSFNLMEIAAREGAMPLFERYRRSLATMPFPPSLAVHFHLHAAESYEALGQLDAATEAAGTAHAIAERHGFSRLAYDAESLVTRLKAGRLSRPAPLASTLPEPLQHIAMTIEQMRKLVPR